MLLSKPQTLPSWKLLLFQIRLFLTQHRLNLVLYLMGTSILRIKFTKVHQRKFPSAGKVSRTRKAAFPVLKSALEQVLVSAMLPRSRITAWLGKPLSIILTSPIMKRTIQLFVPSMELVKLALPLQMGYLWTLPHQKVAVSAMGKIAT